MVASLVDNAGREPGRGAGHRPRRARARRRLRQRQRRDRRGPAHLGQHGRRRLRPGPARARPRAGRRRAPGDRVRRGRRPGAALRGRQLRRRDVDLRRDVRPRPGEDRGRAAARGQARRPDRDGATGRPDGGVGAMFHDDRQARAAAARASPRRCSGAPRSGCASCSATAISDLRVERRRSRQAVPLAPTTTSSSSAPTSARPRWPSRRVGPEGEEALTADLRAYLEEANTAGERALVLEADYLRGGRHPRLAAGAELLGASAARTRIDARRSAASRRRPGRRRGRPAREA